MLKKGGRVVQEADLWLAVRYLDNTNSPGSHCELAPFSVCSNGWIVSNPVTYREPVGDRSLFSTHCKVEATHLSLVCTEVEAVTDFIFLGSRITVDSDCSQEIKRCLLLGRKVMTN